MMERTIKYKSADQLVVDILSTIDRTKDFDFKVAGQSHNSYYFIKSQLEAGLRKLLPETIEIDFDSNDYSCLQKFVTGFIIKGLRAGGHNSIAVPDFDNLMKFLEIHKKSSPHWVVYLYSFNCENRFNGGYQEDLLFKGNIIEVYQLMKKSVVMGAPYSYDEFKAVLERS